MDIRCHVHIIDDVTGGNPHDLIDDITQENNLISSGSSDPTHQLLRTHLGLVFPHLTPLQSISLRD